jgi:hypothetical protein
VFDRQGNLLNALVSPGEGPGEALAVQAVSAMAGDGIIVTHPAGVTGLDGSSALDFTIPVRDHIIRGAVQGCGDGLLALARRAGDDGAPGLLGRLGLDGAVVDTLALLSPLRPGRPPPAFLLFYHPPYIKALEGRVLLYSEEIGIDRIIEISCEGEVMRELPVAEVGPPERSTPREGGITLSSPAPPFPAGFVHVADRIIWAANEGPISSLQTVLTAYGPDGGVFRLLTHGRFQLLDSDESGLLLVGNLGDLLPTVLLVDGLALLELIESRGESVGYWRRYTMIQRSGAERVRESDAGIIHPTVEFDVNGPVKLLTPLDRRTTAWHWMSNGG